MPADHQAILETLARRHETLRLVVTAVHETVVAARDAGASWTEVADTLGITEEETRLLFDP